MSDAAQAAAMMLFSPDGRANPYPIYATLREAAAVLKTPFGGWMVTRYDTVDRILRSAAFRTPRGYRDADDPAGPPRFDQATALGVHRRHWLIFQSGDAHTRLRKLIMKVFTPRAVRALAPRIETLVEELFAPALERGSMEVIADLAYPLPATVICELLGIPAADRDHNRAWAAVTAATIDPMCSDAQIKAAVVAMQEWDGYIRELLALGSANHDPRRYDRPDDLDVARADPKPLNLVRMLPRCSMKRIYGLVLAACLGCGSSSPRAPDAPISPIAAVDSQRFLDDLTAIAGNRPPGSPHWKTVQDLCASRFEALGYAVERHQYATGVNVIGVRPGTRVPGERIVVSAHYDSVPNCAGADDNGSGVAGTLEAARVLSLQPHARTLVVACWDQEEAGLIGSRAYVQRARLNGESIIASFVFEMIGYKSSEPNSQRTDPNLDAVYPAQTAEIAANQNRGDFILVIHDEAAANPVADFEAVAADVGLSTIGLPVSATLKRQASGLRRSDHAPFWDADYPAIMLTDTADFRNPHYHCAGGPDALADIDVEFATRNIKATVGAVATGLDR